MWPRVHYPDPSENKKVIQYSVKRINNSISCGGLTGEKGFRSESVNWGYAGIWWSEWIDMNYNSDLELWTDTNRMEIPDSKADDTGCEKSMDEMRASSLQLSTSTRNLTGGIRESGDTCYCSSRQGTTQRRYMIRSRMEVAEGGRRENGIHCRLCE